ncbi:MAG TPA: amidohydrolase family protein [Anaeromyxobacteraceae bacterium]|nr:amidohydrolase family protein [Anaeromyxobacteraceae bacterium]
METLIASRCIDRHTHPSLYAALDGCPNLSGLDRADALALLRALPGDRLTTVLGWHSGRLPFQEADLERLPPAILVNFSLHGLTLTAAGRVLVAKKDPELAQRYPDAQWCERNMPRLLATYAATAGLSEEKLDVFMQGLMDQGIEAVEDMLLWGEDAWRVMSTSRWAGRMRFWSAPEVYRSLPAEAQAEALGLKLFLDGALGSRTAALSGEYRSGTRGLLLHSDAALCEHLTQLHSLGKPLAIHAIGDLAIEQGLSALEKLNRAGLPLGVVRLEHVQFITEAQGRRARELGLSLSMQPNFNGDSVDYGDRLDPAWLQRNNPFRMLIDRCGFVPGRDLVFGSDGMPHGIECALQRSLFPAFPGQRLSVGELLAGYGARVQDDGPVRATLDEARRSVSVAHSGAE